MTSASTAGDTVANGDEASRYPPAPRSGRGRWFAVGLILAIASLIGASNLTVPYYAIAPGSAVPVAPLVEVAGAPTFEPEGEIYLTTVSLRRTSVLQAVHGWLDPTIDVVEERVIVPPDVERDELREFNLRLMDTSKEQALGVAFERLGYDAIRGEGAQVVQVVDGSPASGVLVPGDTVLAVDGEEVQFDSDAVSLLGAKPPGAEVGLTVRNEDGSRRQETVRLVEHPQRPGRAFLGVTLQTLDPRFDFPFDVRIGSDRIGGPSAGLAFTLMILDVLTEGELTGGRKIAATGTIELDGSVGAVGGVAQKAVAVADAGVELFLVPAAEVEAARRHVGDRLQVEPVETLDDALRILSTFGGNGLALDQPGDAGA